MATSPFLDCLCFCCPTNPAGHTARPGWFSREKVLMEVQYGQPFHSKRLILRVISPGTEADEPPVIQRKPTRSRRGSAVGLDLLDPAKLNRRRSISEHHFL